MTTQLQTPARPAAADLDAATVAEIVGIAELGMPIGPSLALRLCADWRRLTAERDAARATVREWIAANGPGGWIDDLRNCAATAPAPVPTAADVPPFLAHRVNGGA